MAIPLKDLLGRSVRSAGIADQVTAAVVCDQFNRVVEEVLGEVAHDKAKALYVKNLTLTVAVASSALGQEIKLHEQEILEKLQKKVGENQVTRLRFLV